ncbi:MAG: glycosyltransferase [Deltaproteobacteria bacterium]|jgi:glycosyltransferase involved in cell wall biosynthesis|nr:glycosyltransferase [Deltaproteobacteria bacterium]
MGRENNLALVNHLHWVNADRFGWSASIGSGLKVAFVFLNAHSLEDTFEQLKVFLGHLNFIQPVVFFSEDCSFADYLRNNKVEVKILNINQDRQFIKSNLVFYKILKENQIKLVQFCELAAFKSLAWGAKMAGAKIVYILNEIPTVFDSKNCAAFALSDQIVLNSPVLYTGLERASNFIFRNRTWKFLRRWFNSGKQMLVSRKQLLMNMVQVIYHGVELEKFYIIDEVERSRIRQKLGIESSAKVVAYIGEFKSQNQQLEFMQTCALKILTDNQQVNFYFITKNRSSKSQSYIFSCCDFVESFGLQDKMFLTEVQTEIEMLDLLRAIDIVVLSPQAALEIDWLAKVFSLGKPVVTFNLAQHIKEFVGEYTTGVIVPVEDFYRLQLALKELISNDIFYKQCVENALDVSKYFFDVNYAVEKYEKLYRNLKTA